MKHMAAVLLLAIATLPATAGGGETTYHFGVAPNRTTITFESKADLETIIGSSQSVAGSASIDWDAGSGRVSLSVPVASLRTGIDLRDEHLRSAGWLDAATYPAIEFKGEKATLAKPSTWTIAGAFSCHGVTKDVTMTAEVKRIPVEASKKANLGPGEWIRVRSQFDVKLSDHGIKVPEMAAAKVQETWKVTLDLFATSELPKEKMALPESETAKKVKAPEVKVEGSGTRFVFGKMPQLTNFTAESATDLETVVASTGTVSGAAVIDMAKGAGAVKLLVPVASLRTGIEMRDEHLRGSHWLEADKFPDIVFESTKFVRNADGSWKIDGTFTMHGQARPLAVSVTAKEIPADLVKKAGWGDTPGLKIRTSFSVKLSDFGVKVPEMAAAKVNDEWTVTIDAVAISE